MAGGGLPFGGGAKLVIQIFSSAVLIIRDVLPGVAVTADIEGLVGTIEAQPGGPHRQTIGFQGTVARLYRPGIRPTPQRLKCALAS